jgi:hypothetical protein
MHEASKSTAEQIMSGSSMRIRDVLMLGTKLGDQIAVYFGYSVYKYHYDQAKLKPRMTEKKARETGVLEFEKATERAQQGSSIASTGRFRRRGKPIQKLLTLFLSASEAYTRQTIWAMKHFKTDPRGSSKRLLLFNVMLPMLFQAISSGFIGAMRGGDEDEFDEFWSEQLRAVALGPLNGLPIIRDISEGLWEASMGNWYGKDIQYSPAVVTGKSLAEATFYAFKGLREGDNDALITARNDLFDFIGYTMGFPVGPGGRWLEGIEDIASGETEHPIMAATGYSRAARNERDLGD